jgi:VWFA-related protein
MPLRRTSLRGFSFAVVSACLAVHPSAYARSDGRPQPAPTAPTLHVTSRETVVDITVTDANGQPVHGLQEADFILKEDGKPQPLRSFKEFSNERPAVVLTRPKLPANVYTNLQPASNGAVNVILLDFLNSAPIHALTDPSGFTELSASIGNQNWAKQGAMQYLKAMPPGTQVAVFGLSNTLYLLQGFSSDPAILSAAVNTMKYDTDATGQAQLIETVKAQAAMRHRMTHEAFSQIAAYLSGVKGRKNLLWLVRPTPGLDHEVLARLNAEQIAVDPIGLGIGLDLAAEEVAEKTGGVSYQNSNDTRKLIARAIEDGANYYTVSYEPPSVKLDGKLHEIGVKVNRPGLQLVYRKSYMADDIAKIGVASELTPAMAGAGRANMQASMGRSMPVSTELLFDVRVEPSAQPAKPTGPPVLGILDPKLNGKPLTRYSFLYLVPVSQIAFADGPDNTGNGSMDFDIAAYDADGRLVTSMSQTMKLPLTADEFQQFTKSPFQFLQQLDLPAGQLFLRVGILDGVSNKIGTLEVPLTVTKPSSTNAPATAAMAGGTPDR